jgi:hypothetical protein
LTFPISESSTNAADDLEHHRLEPLERLPDGNEVLLELG